jgi:hypothetical protein
MSDSGQGAAQLNKSFVAFVITDLDAALTFLDVADASRIVETKHRNHRNARKAYDAVIRFLQNISPDEVQRAEIDLKLATLESRLRALGEKF